MFTVTVINTNGYSQVFHWNSLKGKGRGLRVLGKRPMYIYVHCNLKSDNFIEQLFTKDDYDDLVLLYFALSPSASKSHLTLSPTWFADYIETTYNLKPIQLPQW
jgi:hypothetical protein